MNLKKSILNFKILLLPMAWLFIYCGWGGYSAPPSFFAPEIANYGHGHPLFYDPNADFYTGYTSEITYSNYYTRNTSDFSNINDSEWFVFFNKKAPKEAIHYFLNTATVGQTDTCLQIINGRILEIQDTSIKKQLQSFSDKKKTRSFLSYLKYALLLQQTPINYWDYDYQMSEDTFVLNHGNQILQEMKTALNIEQSDFIKSRYCFQIERLLYRLNRYDDGILFWKEHEKQAISNSSYYRFLGYAAANYYKKQAYPEASYLYSILYDRFPIMQAEAIWSYAMHEETDLQQCLNLAKTVHEKCVILELYGYNYDLKKSIERIYALNPNSELLPILLSRLVNTEEEKFLAVDYNYNYDRSINGLDATKLDQDAFNLVEKIASENQVFQPAIWHLSAAYFNIVKGNFAITKKHLEMASKDTSDRLFRDQWHIINLLYEINNAGALTANNFELPSFTPEFTNKLINELNWLQNPMNPTLRTSDLFNWCRIYISQVYRNHNQQIAAECFNALSNKLFYNINHIDEMLDFLKKPNKTPFELMLTRLYRFSIDDLNTLKIHELVYAGRFDEAAALQKSEPRTLDTSAMRADPFLIHIRDCHDCDFEAIQPFKYNAAQLIDTLATMRLVAEKNPIQSASLYFAMANCLYNFTFYGNSRSFYMITMNEISYNYYNNDNENQITNLPIFDCSLSESYYRKAMEASSDREFKTRCLFMIAKCRQNEEYNLSNSGQDNMWLKDENFVARDTLFYALKTTMSDTRYYQEIIQECGYFKTYLNN